MAKQHGIPKPTHEQILLVHAYIDGELDPFNAVAVERQIASDPALGAEVERVQALRQVVRDRFPRENVPPHLMSKIEKAIGQTQSPINPSWRTLAASVVLAMGLASGTTWFALQTPLGDQFAEAVVDGHMRALMAPQPADVASSERHTVKPWFNSRIAQSPQVIDLSKEGFPLIGGRIDVIDTKPMPTLVYGRRLHIISVSAVPSGSRSAAPTADKAIKGYNVVHWSEDGFSYWATSDLNVTELLTFARLFQSSLAVRS